MKRIFSLAAILPVMFLISGCATTANLKYNADSPKQPLKQVSVYLEEFKDERPASKKGVIGKLVSPYGGEVATVNEPPKLLQDLKMALEAELINSGYSLTMDQSEIVVKPLLQRIVAESRGNNGLAQIKIYFEVLDHGQQVFVQTYDCDGKFRKMIGYAASEAITAATKKMAKAFIKDLDRYVKS